MDFIIFELSNVIYLLNNNYSTIRHVKGCDWTHDGCPSKIEGLFCPSDKADDLVFLRLNNLEPNFTG